MRLSASIVLLAGACWTTPSGPHNLALDIDETRPVAGGSRTTARFTNRYPGCDGLFCGAPVYIKEYSVEPSGVFEHTQTDAQFDFVAVAEGAARFAATVESGDETRTFAYNLVAQTIDTVALNTLCPSPALMQVGVATALTYEVSSDGTRLGGKGLMPFTITGGQLLPPDKYGAPWLQLPSTPGTVLLTSPYDADFLYQVDVVAPDSIDGMVVTDPFAPLTVGSATDVRADLLVGSRAICYASLPITSSTTSTGICELDPGYGSFSDTIRIRGLAAGDCTLNVTLQGTTITATKTISVTK